MAASESGLQTPVPHRDSRLLPRSVWCQLCSHDPNHGSARGLRVTVTSLTVTIASLNLKARLGLRTGFAGFYDTSAWQDFKRVAVTVHRDYARSRQKSRSAVGSATVTAVICQ